MKNNRRSFIKNLGIVGATAAVIPSSFAAEAKEVNLLNRAA
ncbi:twin-arginine translocation signal domain-containing protein, partial [Salegentibacter sp. BLCTC]|nr:twin-arginine translocation signal domain-containing protein [Salegentibacter sp. BLCTC]MBE7641530.1 twin-arginine translocation signal domain-containing protein [Salegentibacter sp. BLCTC]